MNYRQRLEKEITLPSGHRVKIKKLNAYSAPFMEKRAADDDQSFGIRIATHILTEATGAIDGKYRIVDKPKAEDEETELTVGELEQADAQFIVDEVLEFSGMSKRDREARTSFRDGATQPANGSTGAPTGEGIRTPPNGTLVAASQ